MRTLLPLLVCVLSVCLTLVREASAQGDSQHSETRSIISSLDWERGPTLARIGNRATIEVPESYLFLSPPDSKTLMELLENPSSGNEYLLVRGDFAWFAVFEFDEMGYVKDDDQIDAEAILDSIKEDTKTANAERRRMGWSEVNVIGWHTRPHYNREGETLEWAVLAESNQEKVVNFNTRKLGRKGVMLVNMVCNPDILTASLVEFRSAMTGFHYVSGEKYSEFRSGDRIAEYGLTGLIIGGAAAAAAKSGVLKYLWKFIVGGVVAAIAGIGALFRKRS